MLNRRLAAFLTTALLATVLAALGGLVAVAPAQAATCLTWKEIQVGVGLVKVVCEQWGVEGVEQTGGGDGGGSVSCRTGGGVEVPCSGDAGIWNGSCYVKALDPQPPSDFYLREGRADGYIAWCSLNPNSGGERLIWVAQVPGVDAGPSPRQVADRAVAAMQLTAGQIGITPLVETGAMGIVNMPMWLWIANPGESTTGPITRSATEGAITVTATATLDRVEYAMGDQGTLTCGAGTAYDANRHGSSSSPDCGYTYTRSSAHQPAQAYTITATSYWTVTWTGGGQTGTINLDFDRSIPYQVGEIQVLLEP